MASPVDQNRLNTNVSTAASSWSVSMPTGIAAGELLLIWMRAGTSTFNLPAGWTWVLQNNTTDATDDAVSVICKVATGSEGALTVGLAGSAKGFAVVWRISGAADPATQLPETLSAAFTTTANTADPPSISPTGGSKDYLFIVAGARDGTGTFAFLPSNYTNQASGNSGAGGSAATNCIGTAGSRQLTTATENPGTFTHAAATNGGLATIIAIHPAAAAGTAHTRTPVDTLALADDFARVQTSARTPADPVALTDLLTRVATYARAPADTVALADSCSPVKTGASVAHTRNIGDTVALTDSLAKASAAARTLADAVVLADTPAVQQQNAIQIGDTVALTDTFARTATFARTVTDAAALADQLARAAARARTLADSLAVTDSATPVKSTGSVAHTRTVNDAVALADNAARAKAISKTLADTAALTDTTARARGISRALADTVTLTDAAARARAISRALTDTVALADLFARVAPHLRTIADTVTLTDAAARAMALVRALADTLALADQTLPSTGQGVTVADTVAVTDHIQVAQDVSLAHSVTVTDTVTVTDHTELEHLRGGGHDGYIDFPDLGWISAPTRGSINHSDHGRIAYGSAGVLARTGG